MHNYVISSISHRADDKPACDSEININILELSGSFSVRDLGKFLVLSECV